MQTLSKITSQGQVSVPAAVRRALGLTPGSMLQWVEEKGHVTVRRASRHSTEDIHDVLFPEGANRDAAPKTLAELKQGVRKHMQRRHAGR